MNDELKSACDFIRETVTTKDVADALGLFVDRNSRCACPFHNGKDRNMRIYPGSRGFYCFVCHKSGDCISLAKELLSNDCSYLDAAKWIDSTFRLNVFYKTKPSIWQRKRMLEASKR